MKFTQVLEQAVEAERACRALQADKAAWRLTGEAFVAAALEQAGCDNARLDALEADLERPGLEALRSAFARMCRHVAEVSAPHLRLRHLMSEEGDSQLGAIQGTRPELFALAARHVAATNPDIFGTMTKPGEAAERLEVLRRSRDHLYREVARSWTAADVVIEEMHGSAHARDGWRRVTLKATGTPVGAGMAESAVNALIAHGGVAQAAVMQDGHHRA